MPTGTQVARIQSIYCDRKPSAFCWEARNPISEMTNVGLVK